MFENYGQSWLSSWYRRKRLDVILAEASTQHWKKKLNALDLMALGVGGIIGAGIFSLTGIAAAVYAGPAIVISYVLAGIVSLFAAMSYSEFGSMVPISGSAYSFIYITLGETLAFLIGWDLILEYLVSAAAVAVGWGAYLQAFFVTASGGKIAGFYYPITNAPIVWINEGENSQGEMARQCNEDGECGIINLPAMAICIALTIALVLGTKETAWLNNAAVILKVTIILVFIFACAKWVDTANYNPYIPPNQGGNKYGWPGIFKGAVVVFFAYLGFDAVTTVAQEASKPQRDLPLGIIGSLIIATVLYIAMATVMTGVANYTELDSAAPVDIAIQKTGMTWLAALTDFGALLGLGTVVLVSIMGQPRIFASMARDGLLPAAFAKVNPKTGTPVMPTILCGAIAAIASGLLPIDFLANLTSVGTLLAFFLVAVALPVSRLQYPKADRPFKIGGKGKFSDIFAWIWGFLGAFTSMGLLIVSSVGQYQVIWRVLIWDGIGLILYWSYGVWNSNLARHPEWNENPELHPDVIAAKAAAAEAAEKEGIGANTIVRAEIEEYGKFQAVYPVEGGHAPGDMTQTMDAASLPVPSNDVAAAVSNDVAAASNAVGAPVNDAAAAASPFADPAKI